MRLVKVDAKEFLATSCSERCIVDAFSSQLHRSFEFLFLKSNDYHDIRIGSRRDGVMVRASAS